MSHGISCPASHSVLRLEFTEPRELLSSSIRPIGKPASVRTIHLRFATTKYLPASLAGSTSRSKRITGNRHSSSHMRCNGNPSTTSRFRCQRLCEQPLSENEAIWPHPCRYVLDPLPSRDKPMATSA